MSQPDPGKGPLSPDGASVEELFRVVIDKLGLDQVIAALECRRRLGPGRLGSIVYVGKRVKNRTPLDPPREDQIVVHMDSFAFVCGQLRGTLTYDRAKAVIDSYIADALTPEDE